MNKLKEVNSINDAISRLRVALEREVSRQPINRKKVISLSRRLDILIVGYYQRKYKKSG